MKYFYRLMIWALKFEHAIGSHSGQSHRSLAELRQEIVEFEGRLHRWELNKC